MNYRVYNVDGVGNVKIRESAYKYMNKWRDYKPKTVPNRINSVTNYYKVCGKTFPGSSEFVPFRKGNTLFVMRGDTCIKLIIKTCKISEMLKFVYEKTGLYGRFTLFRSGCIMDNPEFLVHNDVIVFQ